MALFLKEVLRESDSGHQRFLYYRLRENRVTTSNDPCSCERIFEKCQGERVCLYFVSLEILLMQNCVDVFCRLMDIYEAGESWSGRLVSLVGKNIIDITSRRKVQRIHVRLYYRQLWAKCTPWLNLCFIRSACPDKFWSSKTHRTLKLLRTLE